MLTMLTVLSVLSVLSVGSVGKFSINKIGGNGLGFASKYCGDKLKNDVSTLGLLPRAAQVEAIHGYIRGAHARSMI